MTTKSKKTPMTVFAIAGLAAVIASVAFVPAFSQQSVVANLNCPPDCVGTDGEDTIIGGSGNDQIHGLEGDDTLYGNGGDDVLLGYEGDDYIYGGIGKDTLQGNDGNDKLYQNNANNHADGDRDRMWGLAGTDTCFSKDSNDWENTCEI